MNWKRDHEVVNGNLFCTISIYDEKKKEWVSKQDVNGSLVKEKGGGCGIYIVNGGEEMNKISKITTRSTLASAYIEEQKTRGKDEIPENLTEKMYGAITSFKEKYTMIQPNREQLLMSIKI